MFPHYYGFYAHNPSTGSKRERMSCLQPYIAPDTFSNLNTSWRKPHPVDGKVVALPSRPAGGTTISTDGSQATTQGSGKFIEDQRQVDADIEVQAKTCKDNENLRNVVRKQVWGDFPETDKGADDNGVALEEKAVDAQPRDCYEAS